MPAKTKIPLHNFERKPGRYAICSVCSHGEVNQVHFHDFVTTRMANLCACGYGRQNERHAEVVNEEDLEANRQAALEAMEQEYRSELADLVMAAHRYAMLRTDATTPRDEVLKLIGDFAMSVELGTNKQDKEDRDVKASGRAQRRQPTS